MPDVESTAGHVPGLRLRWGDLLNCQLHVFGHVNPPAPPGPRRTTTGRVAPHKAADPPRPARPRIPGRGRRARPRAGLRSSDSTGPLGTREIARNPAQTRLIAEATGRSHRPPRSRPEASNVPPGPTASRARRRVDGHPAARRARPSHRRADAVTVRVRDVVGQLASGRTPRACARPTAWAGSRHRETATAPRARVRKPARAHVAGRGRNPGRAPASGASRRRVARGFRAPDVGRSRGGRRRSREPIRPG